MRIVHETIAAWLRRSAFVLTFETEEVIACRAGSQGDALRALYINLAQLRIEYELTEEGSPLKRRVEYFPTMDSLLEKLPVTIASFDLKFRGVRLKHDVEANAQGKGRTPLAATRDPWDLTNYCGRPRDGRPHESPSLKLEDDE